MPNNQDPNRLQQVNDQLKAAADMSRRTREEADRLIKSFSRVYKEWEVALKSVQETSKNVPPHLRANLVRLDRELEDVLNRGKGLKQDFNRLLQENAERAKTLRALEQRVSNSRVEKDAVEQYYLHNNLIAKLKKTDEDIKEQIKHIDSFKNKKMDINYIHNLEDIGDISRRHVEIEGREVEEMVLRRQGKKIVHQTVPKPSTSKQSLPHTAPAASSPPKQSRPVPENTNWIKQQFDAEEMGNAIKQGFAADNAKKKAKKVKNPKSTKVPAKTLPETPEAKHGRENREKIDVIINVNSKDGYLKSEAKGFAQKSFAGLNTQMQDANISPTRKRQLQSIQRAKDGLDHTGYTPDEKAARLYQVLATVKKEIKGEVNLFPSRLLKQVEKEMATIESKFPSVQKLVAGKTIKQDKRLK